MSVAIVVVPSNAEKRQWLRPDKPSPFYELENSEVTDWIASPRDHITCVRGVMGSGKTTAVRRAVDKMAFQAVEVRTMTEILGGLYPLKTENVALIHSAETSISMGDTNPLSVQLIVFDGIDFMPSVLIEKIDTVFRRTKGVHKPFGSTSCVMTGFYALGPNRCRLATTTLGPGFDYIDVGSFRDAGADVMQIELKAANLRIDPGEYEWSVFLANLHDLIEGTRDAFSPLGAGFYDHYVYTQNDKRVRPNGSVRMLVTPSVQTQCKVLWEKQDTDDDFVCFPSTVMSIDERKTCPDVFPISVGSTVIVTRSPACTGEMATFLGFEGLGASKYVTIDSIQYQTAPPNQKDGCLAKLRIGDAPPVTLHFRPVRSAASSTKSAWGMSKNGRVWPFQSAVAVHPKLLRGGSVHTPSLVDGNAYKTGGPDKIHDLLLLLSRFTSFSNVKVAGLSSFGIEKCMIHSD